MATESSWFAWATAAVTTAIATLSGVIATLFKMRESENTKAIARLDQQVAEAKHEAEEVKKLAMAETKELREASARCEKDRADLFADLKVTKFEVEILKAKIKSIDNNGTKFSQRADLPGESA